jgi:Putative Flp pilus-assembly TadE/G-like
MEHAEMRKNNERGQSMVLTVVFMVVLLGFAALVVDVGSWYRAHRSAQATADASALAGAAVLPDTAAATALATQYANKNGGSAGPSGTPQITITQQGYEMDTIKVKVTRPSPGFFARVFGSQFMNVTVSGTATARAYNVQGIRNGIAPITVNYKHPLLNCTRGQNPTCNPTFGTPTTLTLEDIHTSGGKDAAGSFGLINLNGLGAQNIGAGTLADWLLNGYQDHDLQIGKYDAATGADFNNSQFRSALDQQIGHELLFPVYRLLKGPGSNAIYDIIGWVGYVIDSYTANGSTGTINGHFTRYTTDGVPVENGNGNGGGAPGLGVHKIELTN